MFQVLQFFVTHTTCVNEVIVSLFIQAVAPHRCIKIVDKQRFLSH